MMFDPGKLGLCVLLLEILRLVKVQGTETLWREWWWTYDGISGPDWWGSKWEICGKGKYQSPIDIKPDRLLFDPQLSALIFSNERKINGNLTNTGNDITLFVDPALNSHLNVTSGPLQYNYHLHHVKLHFGPDNSSGSEHTINSLSFPAEIQIIAYNADLYKNYSQALLSPNGVAAFAIFLEISESGNEAFTMIADVLKDIPGKAFIQTGFIQSEPSQQKWINDLPLNILLPNTPQFITYEGSLTQPGCQETVTWIIFNKPIYILNSQLEDLRNVNKEGGGHLMYGNIRPPMPVNNRLIRTNISFKPKTKACSVAKEVFYEVNTIKPKKGR